LFLAEGTKVVKGLAECTVESTGMEDDTLCEVVGENDSESHSPVPSESPTMLESSKEEIAGVVNSTGTEEEKEKPASVNAPDDHGGSDTDSDWTEVWFQEWFAVEEREPLTQNIIFPLMGVNGAFREATLKAINLTLGIKRGRKKM
jgi:hypothetical protein